MTTSSPEPNMDSGLGEEVVSSEQAHAPVATEHSSKQRNAAQGSRAKRKKRNQQQFKKALTKMMTSFEKMFDDSDADISDSDDSLPARVHLRFDEASSRSQSLDRNSEVTDLRRPRRRGMSGDSYELTPRRDPEAGLDLPHVSPRRNTLMEKAEPTAIHYRTELYEYMREGDLDRASFVESRTSSTPRQVIPFEAGLGNHLSSSSNYCFKVVHMYSIPYDRKRMRTTRRRTPSLDSVDDVDSTARPKSEFPRDHQVRPVKVTASLGSYLVIYSEVILSAIRSCVKSYPGLSRAFEFMIIPAPYTLLVQYRKELQEYSDNLPRETVSSVSEGVSPINNREHAEPDEDEDGRYAKNIPGLPQNKHIPELLKYVFTDELTSQLECELSLRTKPVPTCTYALVWLLFRPGTTVYASEGGRVHSAYVVDWYELEGLYEHTTEIIYDNPSRTRRGRYSRHRSGRGPPPLGLTDTVRPPPVPRGERAEFNPVPKSIIVNMHYLEFDGEHVGRRPHQVTIEPFDGEKEIVSLPVYPAEFARGSEAREYLVTRGQKYIKLCQPSYMSYEGDTIATVSTPSRKINARVMIDSRAYYNETNHHLRLKIPSKDGIISDSSSESDSSDIEFARRRDEVVYEQQPRYRRTRTSKRDLRRDHGMADYDLVKPSEIQFTDDQSMLFPARMVGFVLRERRWYLLNVDDLKDAVFQENILDDLVLKEEAKNLIQALSNTAMGDTTIEDRSDSFGHWTADIVQNKGEGRIFLLHGKPGVGKTSTAECVAESARVPLLAITCGDLGTEPEVVEKALMKWFKLATLWKAVLLLDEADVYLESRLSGDLTRNSLVSIFLRALEYYQGVLFLTTNRVGTFDEAMLSRIHVVLHYPAFKDSERQKIWMTSFRKLSEERPDVKVGPGLMDYALENKAVLDLQWNGREIRNAFNTIVALAEFDAEKRRRAGRAAAQITLERSHLMQVVTMSKEFKEYMKSTRGMDESGLARAKRLRNDEAMGRNFQAAANS